MPKVAQGSHMGDTWGPHGSHMGAIWEPYGSHMGAIWLQLRVFASSSEWSTLLMLFFCCCLPLLRLARVITLLFYDTHLKTSLI